MESSYIDPVNIGSEDEATVEEWATLILKTVNTLRENGELPPQEKKSEIVFVDAVVDDPPRRRPDISRAREVLSWEPKWTIEAGLIETIMFLNAEEEGEL